MNKKFKMVMAVIVAIAILATGTFAWQKIIEETNEFTGNKKEITVHDDFDPDKNQKDVYVENRGNNTLYVRIKLDETMNLTSDTWRPGPYDWVTHTYGASATDCGHANIHDHELFHKFFKWTMGGWKFYMPGSGSGNVMHDTKHYNGTELGVQATPNAKIITSAEFLAMTEAEQHAFIGWIYATDGYAYWSQPLKQGEVTGLLLHGVESLPILLDYDYYYAINVIVEVVDRRDIPMWTQGVESVDESGTKHPEASPDGKEVILIIIGDEPDPGQPTLTLHNYPHTVKQGKTVNPPVVTVGPPGAPNWPLIWESSDTNIATVDSNGKITGVAIGTAEISVTAPNGLTESFTIEVVMLDIPATGVAILGGDKSITAGNDYTPQITISPVDSTDTAVWSSSDTNVATVDPATGTITGVAAGEATITVTVGGFTDTITITVIGAPVPATNVEILGGDQEIDIADTYTPTIDISPTNSTDTPVWSSSDTNVATVDPATGTITGVAVGEAIITVTVGNVSDTITVTITDPTLLPLKSGEGPYKPELGDIENGDAYYSKFDYMGNTEEGNAIDHEGAIHLEDVIADGIYTGVTATAIDPRFNDYIYVGYDHHGKMSINFTYRPTVEEWLEWALREWNWQLEIPVKVLLERDDGKSAEVTIVMWYYECLVVIG
jgi:uncharacterized protein YjdB